MKQNFLHIFSNFNFKKKKKKKKKGRAQFVINYHTPSHEPNNSNIF